MRTTLVLLMALVAIGCRSTAEDCVDAAARRDKNAQSQSNTDLTTNVQVADSDGDNNNAPTNANVETMTENMNTAPELKVENLFGSGGQTVAALFANESAGERATVRALERLEQRINTLEDRIESDDALLDTEKEQLQSKLRALETRRVAQIGKLDRYAEAKVAMAIKLQPQLDLSALKQIVVLLQSNQQAGSEKGISDAQGEAIKEAAVAAFARGAKEGGQ